MTKEVIGDDLMSGARQIGLEMFPGDPNARRKVYYLTREVAESERIPHFFIGRKVHALRSQLRDWLTERANQTQKALSK
jgi:hypothetical protein